MTSSRVAPRRTSPVHHWCHPDRGTIGVPARALLVHGASDAVGLIHEVRQDLVELVRYELRDVVVAANDDVASPAHGGDLRRYRLECRIPAPCDDEKRHPFLSKLAQLFSKRSLRRELQLQDRLPHARPLFGAGEVSDRGWNADECAEAGGAVRWRRRTRHRFLHLPGKVLHVRIVCRKVLHGGLDQGQRVNRRWVSGRCVEHHAAAEGVAHEVGAVAEELGDPFTIGFGIVGSPRSFASSMTRPVGSQHLPSLLPQLRLGHEVPIAA